MENDKGQLEDIFAWKMFGYPFTLYDMDYFLPLWRPWKGPLVDFNPLGGFEYHHDFQSKSDYEEILR
jgi:hypothetical protein